MSMIARVSRPGPPAAAGCRKALSANSRGRLRAGQIIPFVGPGLAELSAPSVPLTPEALAAFFGTKVALPRRAKGNPWAAAQHIESFKHRATVTALMAEAFAAPVAPTPLHQLPRVAAAAADRRRLV